MDNVTRALERAGEQVDAILEMDDSARGDFIARTAVLACAQSLPPAMTVAELAAAIEKERA